MSILLSCQSLSKSYTGRPLFKEISFGIAERQRIGLIGPNGSGKSTLLKILAGVETPSSGVVSLRRGTRLGYIPQIDEFSPGLTAEKTLLHALQGRELDDHERELQVQITLGKTGIPDADQPVESLSGGWKKRLAIACELIRDPDLLLIDEPTNHLDLEGILWLEKLLRTAPFAYLVVSHDRYFLENVTDRVVELNRAYPDGFFGAEGAYSDFLVKREEFLHAQAHQEMALANRVRREVEWLRRGPQARTTKAQGRIKQAGQMIENLADLRIRNSQGKLTSIDFDATGRRTRELIVVRDLQKSLGGRTLFRKLSFALSPGMKLGLMGPNGSGKTTLLRLLTGALQPDAGLIKAADGLRVVFFDQSREQLDLNITLRAALAGDRDTVDYRRRTTHVSAWASRFLFASEQLNLSVSELSGGEQARILIARLMLQPADVLILDEPTNDLDIPSLEVLEESLLEFPGAVALVTHDRFMLDRVSTELLSLDGKGGARFFADYAQWQAAQTAAETAAAGRQKSAAPAPNTRSPSAARPLLASGLTSKEQKELNAMEAKISAAEADMQGRMEAMSDPALAADYVRLHQLSEEVHAAQEKVEKLYARWEELEKRAEAVG
ncbi:MAG TPA: ABC-F family ATP-binding cassette domain-containing protein [Armatimonadota bacterium]|nr:ABC-F family ATP-binding cassette domain-containing protein [Armatimonadota bacterium]